MGRYFSNLVHYWQSRPVFSLVACTSALAIGYAAPLAHDRYKRRQTPSLNPSTFTPYTLIANYPVSPTSSIFILRPPASHEATAFLASQWASATSLWSVQAKQPQLQIGREYTPLPPSETMAKVTPPHGDASADMHLLIRREQNGEMTTYLHGLPRSSTVSLRGPYADVRIPHHVDEVLFLAGGTGISPALQVAHIMAQRPGSRVTILWANRHRDEVVGAPLTTTTTRVERSSSSSSSSSGWWWSRAAKKIPSSSLVVQTTETMTDDVEKKGLVVQMLEEMAARAPPGAFAVEYFVDEDDTFIKHRDVRRIVARAKAETEREEREKDKERHADAQKNGLAAAAAAPPPPPPAEAGQTPPGNNGRTKLILVSGPEGFVDYWAGRKRLEDGQEVQGPLGGALGEMQVEGWKVWKL
jgi:hypothetical protein